MRRPQTLDVVKVEGTKAFESRQKDEFRRIEPYVRGTEGRFHATNRGIANFNAVKIRPVLCVGFWQSGN